MTERGTEDWRALTASAVDLLRQGQPQHALERLLRAERAAPQDRDVRYWLGNALRMTGQAGRARRLLRGLLAERPDDLEVAFALAFLLRDTGAPGGAAEVLLKTARQPALTDQQLLQIAGFLRDANRFEAAIEVCERLVQQNPTQADFRYKLARLYQATGDFDGARLTLHKALELQPAMGPAWITLAQQTKFESESDEDFRRIEAAAARSLGHETDMCVAFAHAKALDDLGRWTEAWDQYVRGNRLMRMSLPWNRREWEQFVEQALTRSSGQPANDTEPYRRAIFIIGMPRSGTTLLERLLSRHPDISGRGELNFLGHFAAQRLDPGTLSVEQRREAGDAIWTQMRLDGPESGFYIDKNPLNFRYLDMLFQVLPTARVLHLERDGRASGLSCFFQPFKHPDTSFSYDLEDLVHFYSGYRRLMAHWESTWPDRILRVRYDDLVRSTPELLAQILEFLGCGWNESVIKSAQSDGLVRSASAWQARQAVHQRSVDRWKNYYGRAPDFFDRIAAIDSLYLSSAAT